MIQQCVYSRLALLRLHAVPGTGEFSINRPIARILNTFEPGRTQTKPFLGVRELSTLRRYSNKWSLLLLFLLRTSQTIDFFPDHSHYEDSLLRPLISRLRTASERLHAANVDSMEYEDCLNSGRPHAGHSQGSDSDLDSEEEEEATDLRLHAVTLRDAVDQLSMSLVRQEHDRSQFQCGVIAFAAFLTLTPSGAWVSAADFGSTLSGLIHCMQLWLLGYCLWEFPNLSTPTSLQQFFLEECQRFLLNTTATPVAELSYWRLMSRTASNDSIQMPITTVSTDLSQVSHSSIVLQLDDWRVKLRQLLDHASQTLNDILLFGLHAIPVYPVSSLFDNFADHTPGHCFLDAPTNGLHAVQDWLFHRIRQDTTLQKRFFKTPKYSTDVSPEPQLRESRINEYLHANQLFLQLLAVLIYWTSGLPPRRKELIGIRWCNEETARNIYIHNGAVLIVTGYHKSEWRVGTRPVARVLPSAVGELLIRYLIYIPPLVRFFGHCMQTGTKDRMQSTRTGGFLFSDIEAIWEPNQLGNVIKRHSARLLGFSINVRQWRHIAIALDRRILLGVGCQTYGVSAQWGQRQLHAVDGSDSEIDDPGLGSAFAPAQRAQAVVHSGQAGHTLQTNITTYGNPLSLTQGLTDTLLAAFENVSREWHGLCGLHGVCSVINNNQETVNNSQKTASNRKRSLTANIDENGQLKKPAIFSELRVRRKLWNWPALKRVFHQLLGPLAQPRSSQKEALSLIASSRPEALIILPTASGKTLLYILPTLLPLAQVTVVIVPLIALKQDLIQRCIRWKLAFVCYEASQDWQDRLHAVPSLILVDIDIAVSAGFRGFLQTLHRDGRLDRLIIDEAHLILTSAHYREKLGLLGVLRQVPCPIVCMTATLPPLAVNVFKEQLRMTQLETLRSSCDRPNLEYCVQSLKRESIAENSWSDQDLLIHRAVEICRNDVASWQQEAKTEPVTARSLCYVRSKEVGQRIADSLQTQVYHAGLSTVERNQVWTAWSQGDAAPVMVATTALSAGVDYPAIRRVLHVDAPMGLVNYAQETGRAGRDGLPAVCSVLLAGVWSVTWDIGNQSDFLIEDYTQMTRYLNSKSCLRSHLTAYLDGWMGSRLGTACSEPDPRGGARRVFCGNCQQSPSPQTRPLLIETAPFKSTERTQEQEHEHEHEQEQEHEQEHEHEQEVYSVARRWEYWETMERQEATAVFEARLARWGNACIPCSLASKRLVEGEHNDCVQRLHAAAIDGFRKAIVFARFSACFRCGLPGYICQQRGKKGCRYLWVLKDSCWALTTLDTLHGADLVRCLGGPQIVVGPTACKDRRLLAWLGSKTSFYGHEGSNAAWLLHCWLDRLEAYCSPLYC